MEIVLSHQQFNFTDIKSRLQTQSLLRDIAQSILQISRVREIKRSYYGEIERVACTGLVTKVRDIKALRVK